MEKMVRQCNLFIDLLHRVIVVLYAEQLFEIFLVNLLEPALSVVLPVLPAHDLDAGHDVLKQLPVDFLRETHALVRLLFNVKNIDKQFNCST